MLFPKNGHIYQLGNTKTVYFTLNIVYFTLNQKASKKK